MTRTSLVDLDKSGLGEGDLECSDLHWIQDHSEVISCLNRSSHCLWICKERLYMLSFIYVDQANSAQNTSTGTYTCTSLRSTCTYKEENVYLWYSLLFSTAIFSDQLMVDWPPMLTLPWFLYWMEQINPGRKRYM